MVLNNKAQGMSVAFMLAVVIIIFAVAVAPTINLFSTNAMNETSEFGGMNCTDTTDDFLKAGCRVADLTQLYFIGGLIAIAGIVIAARVIFS